MTTPTTPDYRPGGFYTSHVIACPFTTHGGSCTCPPRPIGSRGLDYASLIDKLSEGHYADDNE